MSYEEIMNILRIKSFDDCRGIVPATDELPLKMSVQLLSFINTFNTNT